MGRRTRLGGLPLAALVAWAMAACKEDKPDGKDKPDNQDKKETSRAVETAPVSLDTRCEQVARACADTDKHVDKLTAECVRAAAKQTDKGCTDLALAAYDCYEARLCGKVDKVWALDDFRVLVDRHDNCRAERDALRDCVGN
jgi:hypothetical protein